MSEKSVIITMLKDDLNDIKSVPLPSSYSMRSYKPGDRKTWVSLYSCLDEYYNVTEKDFDLSFGEDHITLSKNMFFLCCEGKEVGTITAWPEEDTLGRKTSRLHWAGVHQDHRGKRLGSYLVSFILNHMKENGCKSCILGTNEKRLPALHMYLRFGFVPAVIDEKYSTADAQKASWRRVKQNISEQYKGLITF